jgi:hypothetical protein
MRFYFRGSWTIIAFTLLSLCKLFGVCLATHIVQAAHQSLVIGQA